MRLWRTATAGDGFPRQGLRWPGLLVCILAAMVLAGCAAQQRFSEANVLWGQGQAEAGIAKLEEAVKLEPGNMEYRIALASRRASLLARVLTAADLARREGRWSDAERAYGQALAYDQNSVMARQGLDAVNADRRHRQAVSEAEALVAQGSPPPWAEAQERIRKVLAENPQHKEALALKARIGELQQRQSRPEARLAAAYRKPITLEFRDAPLRSVFDLVAKVSGLNFFFDKDIRPDLRATILARNTSIEDAVRLLLVTNQLEQKVLNENSILIYPNTPQKLKDYQTLTVRTFYLANGDVKAVSNTIKTIVKTKDLVVDERLGLIIVRDTPEAIRLAERIVALQDISDPEVVLDVEILEVQRSKLLDLGIGWPGQLSLAPLVPSGGSLTLDALRSLNGGSIQATVGNITFNASQQDQDTNTLANPKIRVRNKEKASILIGDKVPIITTTSTSTGFVAESVNYVDVGLKLEVEPNIHLDDEVAMRVKLEVSTLGARTESKAGTITYQIGTRGANTVLRLKDGETQILAGLINDEERSSGNKVPGFGDLPVAGRLFGAQNDSKRRSEILLSITPRIVRAIRRPDLVVAEFESGTESNVGSEALRLSVVEPATVGKDATAARAAATAPGVAPTPAPAPAAVTPPSGAAVAASVRLSWQAPAQVRAGEQFSAALVLQSSGPVRGLPFMIGFDPQLLQLVSVSEGEFFKQGGGRTTFTHRIDAVQGKVFVAAVRQAGQGSDPGVNGSSSVAQVTFKALKPNSNPRIQLLSATPEPAPAQPVALPVEVPVRVMP